MRPDDNRPATPYVPPRDLASRVAERTRIASQEAASNVVRDRIDTIYTNDPTHTAIEQESGNVTEAENPYDRTLANADSPQVEQNQWQQYHSAWQDYYQKYYERYYIGQVHKARTVLEDHVHQTQPVVATLQKSDEVPNATESLDKKEALYELRSKLLDSVQTSAKKVRKSRHFIPITAASLVMVIFLFLQYNRVLFANVQAYVSPGSIDPQNIIVDPNTDVVVSQDPKLIIPKINVDVPVIYDTQPDYTSQMKAMESGVAYFGIPGANSKPGQVGNTVLSGHSSNDFLDSGDYKFIFALLEKLGTGDTIYVNYQGKRYIYTVTKTEVVKPTDVAKLVYPTDKPVLTLITCTPLGTSQNRLLVTAEQISPSPSAAAAAPTNSGTPSTQTIPGNSPTFVQRILGATEN
ncbi:MAG: sortase [Candidatus Saccharimonadales bacterium]